LVALITRELARGEVGLNLNRYLCEKYDKQNQLVPKEAHKRVKVLQWVPAAESNFMLHSLAITYTRWNAPENVKETGDLDTMERGMSVNMQKDLDWLEDELLKS
jgi:glutathione S-transferase